MYRIAMVTYTSEVRFNLYSKEALSNTKYVNLYKLKKKKKNARQDLKH